MTYGTLALIVAVGLLGPVLEVLPTPLAPPMVIGEIAAGVLVGTTGTRSITPADPTLAFLADIGFALLMFIVATHLPLRDSRLRGALRRAAVATAVAVGVSVVLAPVVAAITDLHRPAVLAVLMASSSAAIVLPIVATARRDVPLLVTIAWVSLADVVTVLAVPFVLATGGVARVLAGSALVVAGAAAIGLAAHRFAHVSLVETLRHASHRLSWALDLRLSLLALFTLAWIAERFDTSVLIAGFAAGVMVSLLGEPRRVADQLIGLGEGFFVPLFFVVLGARLDLRALVHSRDDLVLLASLAVATTLVPVVAAAAVRVPLGYGLLGAAEMGVPSAIASLGLASGALRPGQAAAIMGAAALSLAVASIGAARIGATRLVNPPGPDGGA